MKLGIIQQSNSVNQSVNIAKLEQNIRVCASQGAELIVLQELHNGLYFCQTEDTTVFEQAET
ncbi:MAG TPA: acyltransferase, partial [Paludibacter sp.]